jgi:hypothetical protein
MNKTWLLIILSLFLIVPSVVAYNTFIDFTGTNSWAYQCRATASATLPPSNDIPPGGSECSDITTGAALDSSNDNRQTTTGYTTGYPLYQQFKFNSSIPLSQVSYFNFSWEGYSGGTGTKYIIPYIWNYSSSSWKQLDSFVKTSSDVIKVYNFTEKNDYINSSNGMIVFLVVLNDSSLNHDLRTDYVSLNITYNDLVVNTPASNQNVLNSLSTVLNVSSSGYNNTIWYSWNGGITNNTLCTTCSSPNNKTITFPRQGYFNLTVWGNDSSNNIITKNINNINIYNSTILNTTEDVTSTSAYGYDFEALFKFDTSSLINKYLINAKLFFNSKDYVASQNNNVNITLVANQTWDESIAGSTQASCDKYNNLTGTYFINSINEDLSGYVANRWFSINITNAINSSILNNSLNTSIKILNSNMVYSFPFICSRGLAGTFGVADYIDFSGTNTVPFGYDGGSGTTHQFMIPDRETGVNITYLLVNYALYPSNISLNITTQNNSVISQGFNISYNISDDNDYIKNISLYLDGTLNQSISNTPTYVNQVNQYNFTLLPGLSSGSHTYYIVAYDSDNVANTTQVYTLTVDTIAPVINIINPLDYQSYSSGNNIAVNFSSIDAGIGVDQCWWSNSSGAVNYTLVNCANFTVSETTDGTYNMTIWSNDTFGNLRNATVRYVISTTNPNINLIYPTNNQYFINGTNLAFNFTVTDGHTIDECKLWTNTTGTWAVNQTITGVSNNTVLTNFSKLNLSDGTYKWNVWCNESNGQNGTYAINYTFTVDTIAPTVWDYSRTAASAYTNDITYLFATCNKSGRAIDYVTFYLTNPVGTIYTYTSSAPYTGDLYRTTGTILNANGQWNYTNITCYDILGNYQFNETGLTIDVTTYVAPEVPGGSTGGGGPPPTSEEDIKKIANETVQQTSICGNNICNDNENPFTCSADCPLNLEDVFCVLGTSKTCPAWAFNGAVYVVLGTLFVALYIRTKNEKQGRK